MLATPCSLRQKMPKAEGCRLRHLGCKYVVLQKIRKNTLAFASEDGASLACLRHELSAKLPPGQNQRIYLLDILKSEREAMDGLVLPNFLTYLLGDIVCGRSAAAFKTIVGSYENVSRRSPLSVIEYRVEFGRC